MHAAQRPFALDGRGEVHGLLWGLVRRGVIDRRAEFPQPAFRGNNRFVTELLLSGLNLLGQAQTLAAHLFLKVFQRFQNFVDVLELFFYVIRGGFQRLFGLCAPFRRHFGVREIFIGVEILANALNNPNRPAIELVQIGVNDLAFHADGQRGHSAHSRLTRFPGHADGQRRVDRFRLGRGAVLQLLHIFLELLPVKPQSCNIIL